MRPLIGLLALLAIVGAVACLVLLVPRPLPLVATLPAWPAVVTTLAGDGTPALRDGPAWTAQFAEPFGIAVTADGDAYISDAADNNRIRFLSRHGWVATLAGGNEGFLDGRGSSAAFNSPSGIALDAAGALLVADTGNHAIRRVTGDGSVSTVAGTGAPGFADGPATDAQFDGPIGIATDRAGRVWVADTYNFLYIVTNTMRDGRAATDFWDTSLLTPGDYTLRIIARDASGNEATQNTDIPVVVR